jgi:hypothetical protein
VQDAGLGDDGAERARAHARGDELRESQEDGRERELRGARDAGGIVEQLAEEKLHAPRMGRGPRDQATDDGVESRGPRLILFLERASHLGDEVLGDLGEHRGVELLLLREVVDHGRERQPRRLGDVAHAGPMEPGRREQPLRRPHDLPPRP